MATMVAQHLLKQQLLGLSCMATFATLPSAMETAFGRLHNRGVDASGAVASNAGSTVAESIVVDGRVANTTILIQLITDPC